MSFWVACEVYSLIFLCLDITDRRSSTAESNFCQTSAHISYNFFEHPAPKHSPLPSAQASTNSIWN